MKFSERTKNVLSRIEAMSSRKLVFGEEVGTIMEAAFSSHLEQTLDELSFQAKFAYKTYGIMTRIGKDADGFDKLSTEFSESIEKAKNLLHQIGGHLPSAMQERLTSEFLQITPAAFKNLMTLFQDLSWYKNYLIDSSSRDIS